VVLSLLRQLVKADIKDVRVVNKSVVALDNLALPPPNDKVIIKQILLVYFIISLNRGVEKFMEGLLTFPLR
jgi:hypothetical protein